MAKIEELFHLLQTSLNTSSGSTISVNKKIFNTVVSCLQNMHRKIDMLKIQNKLLSDELSLLRQQHVNGEKEDNKHISGMNQVSEFNGKLFPADTRITNADPNEKIMKTEDNIIAKTNEYKVAAKFVKPWEELLFKRNRYGLGYEKCDHLFHIPDYRKPVSFVSGGFLDDANQKEDFVDNGKNQVHNDIAVKTNDRIDTIDDDKLSKESFKCHHCHRVGHVASHCFDLHPCCLCGKKNHLSDRCQKNKKLQRKHISFEWLGAWRWRLEANLLARSYRRVHTHVQPNLQGAVSTVDGSICFVDSWAKTKAQLKFVS